MYVLRLSVREWQDVLRISDDLRLAVGRMEAKLASERRLHSRYECIAHDRDALLAERAAAAAERAAATAEREQAVRLASLRQGISQNEDLHDICTKYIII